jgi:hypothetical protein
VISKVRLLMIPIEFQAPPRIESATRPPLDPSISGIHLGVTQDEVVQRLGKPIKVTSDPDELAGGGDANRFPVFEYPGVRFVFDVLKSGRTSLMTIEILGSAIHLDQGIRVGDSIGYIIKKFGPPIPPNPHDEGSDLWFKCVSRHSDRTLLSVRLDPKTQRVLRIFVTANFD